MQAGGQEGASCLTLQAQSGAARSFGHLEGDSKARSADPKGQREPQEDLCALPGQGPLHSWDSCPVTAVVQASRG